MSVIVRDLTKVYGTQKAINQVSFEAKKGEIVGFLGPNGAGKTTTMKILTCFIPQTSGEALVCDYDVQSHPDEVRQRIGYLPEHNPLYKDMYVQEYLGFIANLHRLSNKKRRVKEVIEQTGLTREQHKPIGALSKGYRQRVGLAQAIIHEPEVLVLDEPTSGLDPNQLIEIRQLIKTLGKEKTVLFSSHIMQEVQAICDRVLIINKGQLVANDSIEVLQQRVSGKPIINVTFDKAIDKKQLMTIKGVENITDIGTNRWQFTSTGEEDIRPSIFNFAVRHQLIILELYKETSSIETVFQTLTKL